MYHLCTVYQGRIVRPLLCFFVALDEMSIYPQEAFPTLTRILYNYSAERLALNLSVVWYRLWYRCLLYNNREGYPVHFGDCDITF